MSKPEDTSDMNLLRDLTVNEVHQCQKDIGQVSHSTADAY